MKIRINGGEAAADVQLADTFLTRFLGLMGRRSLPEDGGLLLKDCGSIHTCFMRFPIDVIYLSADYRVLDAQTVRPWRMGTLVRGAKHTLELNAGKKEMFHAGDILTLCQEG